MLEMLAIVILTYTLVMLVRLSRRSRRNYGLKNYDRRPPPDGAGTDCCCSGSISNMY